MAFIRRASRALILAAMAGGCVDPRQAAIDDAYHSGQISSAQRRQRLAALDEQRLAEQQASIRRHEQQPSGKPADGLVYPQHEDE